VKQQVDWLIGNKRKYTVLKRQIFNPKEKVEKED
jgi:hypothetical protein